jgi:hypothetical protein
MLRMDLLESSLVFPVTVIHTDTTGFSSTILGSRNALPRAETGQPRFRMRGRGGVFGQVPTGALWRATVAHMLKRGSVLEGAVVAGQGSIPRTRLSPRSPNANVWYPERNGSATQHLGNLATWHLGNGGVRKRKAGSGPAGLPRCLVA